MGETTIRLGRVMLRWGSGEKRLSGVMDMVG
jgi:hypothetical protein